MRDFQWIATDFLLRHLSGKLIASLIVLLAIIALTAVFVALELRRKKGDGHDDQ